MSFSNFGDDCSNKKVHFLPESWKSKIGPSNSSYLSNIAIFHFHDYGSSRGFTHLHGRLKNVSNPWTAGGFHDVLRRKVRKTQGVGDWISGCKNKKKGINPSGSKFVPGFLVLIPGFKSLDF